MLDLCVRGARRAGSSALTSIGIADGKIIEPEGAAREVIDVDGALVTPALVEPHIHLDAVLTVGQPRYNRSGSLFEGIAIWAERVQSLTVQDVKTRAGAVLRWQLANGVLHVRSHVDVCDPQLRALRALVELREEVREQIDVHLVAFPQQGIYAFDGGEQLMREAVRLGADVVGGIPHYELTREDGVKSVQFALELAAEHGLAVDLHCDETDDDHSRFLEVLAAETIRRGLVGHAKNSAGKGGVCDAVEAGGMRIDGTPTAAAHPPAERGGAGGARAPGHGPQCAPRSGAARAGLARRGAGAVLSPIRTPHSRRAMPMRTASAG